MDVMDAKQTVRMNPGEGETSYARNSKFQSAEQSRMSPLIEAAIKELCCATTLPPNSVVIADLGCSSGPNAIALTSTAVEAIHHQYVQLQLPQPELSLHLNDLPSNDFNTVVKHLAVFQQRFNGEKGQEVLSPLAPEDLVKNDIPMYQSNHQLWQQMRPVVLDAYARQFRKDFMYFLRCRAQELTPGGRMVLSLNGTHSTVYTSEFTQTWGELVSRILDDMASRSVLDKEKLRTFYIPIYAPCEMEVKEIIEEQGCFSISNLQVHDSLLGVNKALINSKVIAHGLSAAFGPMIRDHFGSSEDIMNQFVRTAAQHMTPDNLHDELASNPRVFIAMILVKKG